MKVRQNPPEAGVTTLGACLPNASVAEATEKFMKTIGYNGIVDIDYVFDARDGCYKVVDVNPRIGCTFRLLASDTGMDVARALYFDLTGQPIVAGNPLPGRKWMVEPADLASGFHDWSAGRLTLTDWARSFSGLQECAYFAVDDPSPMIAMFASYLQKLVHVLKERRQPPVAYRSPFAASEFRND
jgi:predicted ATP-grasp superfamily ATP-dependent carboligase